MKEIKRVSCNGYSASLPLNPHIEEEKEGEDNIDLLLGEVSNIMVKFESTSCNRKNGLVSQALKREKFFREYVKNHCGKKAQQKFIELGPTTIFLSLVGVNIHPEIRKDFLRIRKLKFTKEDFSPKLNLLDKLLILREHTEKKILDILRDLFSVCPVRFRLSIFPDVIYYPFFHYDPSSMEDVEEKFWVRIRMFNPLIMENLNSIISERIRGKDLQTIVFKKLLNEYVREEADYLKTLISEECMTAIEAAQTRLELRQQELMVKDSVYNMLKIKGKPYADKFIRIFRDEIVTTLY